MVENVLQAKKDYSRFALSLLIIGVITNVLQLVLSFALAALPADSAIVNAEITLWILTMAPMYLVAVPVGFLLMKTVPAEIHPKQKITIGRFLILMLICMPIIYAGNFIGNILSMLLSGGTAENALNNYVMGNPFYAFICTVVLAPFLEEFLFRKQIIDRLGKYGEKTAIIFSGVTFGLFHMNLFQFFYAFGLGLIFAYVYTRTRMLRYSVLMHAIINFMGAVIAPALLKLTGTEMVVNPESMEQILEVLPGLLVMLLYSMTLIGLSITGLVLLIVRWKKRVLVPASHEIPGGTVGKYVYRNVGMISFTVFCLLMIALSLF